MATTDALPVPRKNAAYRITFPLYKDDGTLITGATTPDSEVSLDAGTFADCTNEVTEIATSSGVYYIDLTAAEMNADTVCYKFTCATANAVPVVLTLYPEETGDIRTNVTAFGSTAGTFASGRPEVNATHFAGTAYATALAAEVDAIHDDVCENSKTFRQMFRLMYAALCNKVSGLGTTTVTFRDDADSKDRIIATVDGDGNRSAIGTKDGT